MKSKSRQEVFDLQIAHKISHIESVFSEMTLDFKGNYRGRQQYNYTNSYA